jgi:peptidoglycan/LPS O-acetylase OafA/YrhL
MQPEFCGSLFLFAFLGMAGSRRSRFFLYPLMALVIYRLELHWLNAFVAGIALCDLFVNRSAVVPARRMSSWLVLNVIRRSRLVAVVLWILVLVCVGFPDYYGISWLLTATAAVSLTLVSAPTQWLLSRRVPVFLGKISFGLYLIHVPLICSFSSWAYLAGLDSLGPDATPLLVSAGTCALSVALAYTFYLGVDRPALRISRWLSHRAINARGYSPRDEPLRAEIR